MLELPEYMTENEDGSINVEISDWSGEKTITVAIDDILEYFKTQANNIVSGCRTLAGHSGDWRPIDNLAQECLAYYKETNIDKLREKSIEAGLTPKF